jgi:hypothetical protein
MNQHGRHPHELDQLGERLLVVLGLFQGIEIHPGEGGQVAQDFADLFGKIGFGSPDQAKRIEKPADPVVESERAFAKRGGILGGGGEPNQGFRPLELALDGQTALTQGRSPLGGQGRTRLGPGRDLAEPGFQGVRIPPADQTTEQAVCLTGRGSQRSGVEIAPDIRVEDVRGDLPSLKACLGF